MVPESNPNFWNGFTLPETNNQLVPENGPEPQKETIVIPTDSNHPFSGAMLSGDFFIINP